MSTCHGINVEALHSLQHLSRLVQADLLSSGPLGIKSHLLHALEAAKRGDRDMVKHLASRAYQLGYELCDPQARRDAEKLLNAVGLVIADVATKPL